MGEIYRNCQKVAISLGDEDHETEPVVDFIKSTFEEIEQKVPERPQYRDLADIIWLYGSRIERHIIEESFRPELLPGWSRFEHLLQRAWWT
jgi:hypothetical protein